MLAAPDHLVIAAPSLAEGVAAIEARLGVPLTAGGSHAAMGTHNALLSLGPGFYLEVIAVDPAAAPAGRPRWFGLDHPPANPRLVHWVARTADLAACRDAAIAPTDLMEMARAAYRWRFAVTPDGEPPFGGAFPALIQWLEGGHPSERLPDHGCRLVRLTASHPEAKDLAGALTALGLEGAITVTKGAPSLRAELSTPRGRVWLPSVLPQKFA